jgi:hypothetical protein
MRKTVHEWLETHDQGRQMGKKRRAEIGPGRVEGKAVAKKKKVAKKVVRTKGKRKPK